MPEETHTPDKDEKTKISKYQKLKTKKKKRCLKKKEEKKLKGEKSFSSQRLSDLCGISPLLHSAASLNILHFSKDSFFFSSLLIPHLRSSIFFTHFLFIASLAKVSQVNPRAGYRPTSSHRRSRRRSFYLVRGGGRVEFSAAKCHDSRVGVWGEVRSRVARKQRPRFPSETQTSEDPV